MHPSRILNNPTERKPFDFAAALEKLHPNNFQSTKRELLKDFGQFDEKEMIQAFQEIRPIRITVDFVVSLSASQKFVLADANGNIAVWDSSKMIELTFGAFRELAIISKLIDTDCPDLFAIMNKSGSVFQLNANPLSLDCVIRQDDCTACSVLLSPRKNVFYYLGTSSGLIIKKEGNKAHEAEKKISQFAITEIKTAFKTRRVFVADKSNKFFILDIDRLQIQKTFETDSPSWSLSNFSKTYIIYRLPTQDKLIGTEILTKKSSGYVFPFKVVKIFADLPLNLVFIINEKSELWAFNPTNDSLTPFFIFNVLTLGYDNEQGILVIVQSNSITRLKLFFFANLLNEKDSIELNPKEPKEIESAPKQSLLKKVSQKKIFKRTRIKKTPKKLKVEKERKKKRTAMSHKKPALTAKKRKKRITKISKKIVKQEDSATLQHAHFSDRRSSLAKNNDFGQMMNDASEAIKFNADENNSHQISQRNITMPWQNYYRPSLNKSSAQSEQEKVKVESLEQRESQIKVNLLQSFFYTATNKPPLYINFTKDFYDQSFIEEDSYGPRPSSRSKVQSLNALRYLELVPKISDNFCENHQQIAHLSGTQQSNAVGNRVGSHPYAHMFDIRSNTNLSDPRLPVVSDYGKYKIVFQHGCYPVGDGSGSFRGIGDIFFNDGSVLTGFVAGPRLVKHIFNDRMRLYYSPAGKHLIVRLVEDDNILQLVDDPATLLIVLWEQGRIVKID